LQSQARHIEDEQSSTVPLRGLGRTPLRVSMLGFGSSPLGNVFQQTDPAEADATVSLALGRGINFFDVSPFYGGTLAEQRLGEALKGHFAEHRDKIVLATKCGRYGAETFDFSAARTFASIDESLIRLNTSYVDLLQVHDVEFGDIEQIIHETIPALRIIQQSGKARYIGITGYSLPPLIKIAEQAPVDTILTYCRHNLMVTDMDEVLVPFARQHGVGLINASALHMGLLTDHTVPAWHPAPPEVIEERRSLCDSALISPMLRAPSSAWQRGVKYKRRLLRSACKPTRNCCGRSERSSRRSLITSGLRAGWKTTAEAFQPCSFTQF
jgi:L-galactose dehydrogenase